MNLSIELGAQASGYKQPVDERAASPRPRAITNHELFRGARELIIIHQNEEYRLRITRQGKLILTK